MQTQRFFILEQGTVSLLSLSKILQPAQSLDQYAKWNVVKGVRISKNITVALDLVGFLLGIIVPKICFLISFLMNWYVFYSNPSCSLFLLFDQGNHSVSQFSGFKKSQDSQTTQESNKASTTKILKCFTFPILYEQCAGKLEGIRNNQVLSRIEGLMPGSSGHDQPLLGSGLIMILNDLCFLRGITSAVQLFHAGLWLKCRLSQLIYLG